MHSFGILAAGWNIWKIPSRHPCSRIKLRRHAGKAHEVSGVLGIDRRVIDRRVERGRTTPRLELLPSREAC